VWGWGPGFVEYIMSSALQLLHHKELGLSVMQVDDTLELFNELQLQHQAVATKTKTLHDACDRLVLPTSFALLDLLILWHGFQIHR